MKNNDGNLNKQCLTNYYANNGQHALKLSLLV